MTTGHYVCNVKRKIHREDILKAGRDLMFLNGYNATGIKDITNKISIPKGSFYNHFNSKEEFGLEVVRLYCEGGTAMYEKRFLNPALPAYERIDVFFTDLIRNYKEEMECRLGCIMSNFSTEMGDVNEHFRDELNKGFSDQEAIVRQCIAEGQKAGNINKKIDASLMATIFLNGWHGSLVRMKSAGSVQPLEDFKTFMLEQLKP